MYPDPVTYMDLSPGLTWINERETVRQLKEAGEPKEVWTDDPILQQFRFCNVEREQDRVTKWVKENIRDPYADNENLWLMLLIARLINWPDTIQELIDEKVWPVDYPDFARMSKVLQSRKDRGDKVYTGAYMVRAESNRNVAWYDWSKQRYVCEKVFKLAYKSHPSLYSAGRSSVHLFTDALSSQYGIGPFIAYQVAVDLSWVEGWLLDAPDLNTWAALGPGTLRGLNRLSGRKPTQNRKFEQMLGELLHFQKVIQDAAALGGLDHPHLDNIRLSDVANCCCEVDKYLRVLNSEGRPRALYVEGRGY